jgi:hypothetical protein
MSREELRRIEDQLWHDYHLIMADTGTDPNVMYVNKYTHDLLRMADTANKTPEHTYNTEYIAVHIPDGFTTYGYGNNLVRWRGLRIVVKLERDYRREIEASFGIMVNE